MRPDQNLRLIWGLVWGNFLVELRPLPLRSGLEARPLPIRLCLLGELKPGRRQAVKAEAAKRGRESASLYDLTPVRFTVAGSKPTADVIWPHRARASGAMRRDRQSSG